MVNFGVVFNFNCVFEVVSGKYFKWVVYDDYFGFEFLVCIVVFFEVQLEVVFVLMCVCMVDENDVVLGEFMLLWKQFVVVLMVLCFVDFVFNDCYCYEVFGFVCCDVFEKILFIVSYVGLDCVLCVDLGLFGFVLEVEGLELFFCDYFECFICVMLLYYQ